MGALLPWVALGAMAMLAPAAVWATTRISYLPAENESAPVIYPAVESQQEESQEMSEMKPRQQFRQWLGMWLWRIQESATAKLPRRLERFVCPFCRAMNRNTARQEAALRWMEVWNG